MAGTDLDIKKEAVVTIDGAVYAGTKVKREAVDAYAGTTVTITGSVTTGKLELGTPPVWEALSKGDWNNRSSSCPTGSPFLPWMANSLNWLLWPLNYTLYGLSSEPTFVVTRPADASYSVGMPLFRPDPSAWNSGGGYRWAVLTWGETQ